GGPGEGAGRRGRARRDDPRRDGGGADPDRTPDRRDRKGRPPRPAAGEDRRDSLGLGGVSRSAPGRARRDVASEAVEMQLDPDLLLRAYAAGVFPMADSRDAADVYWVQPRRRAILPLDGFRLSRSLRKTLRSDRFEVTRDRAF